MPLPPLLAERLKRRKILRTEDLEEGQSVNSNLENREKKLNQTSEVNLQDKLSSPGASNLNVQHSEKESEKIYVASCSSELTQAGDESAIIKFAPLIDPEEEIIAQDFSDSHSERSDSESNFDNSEVDNSESGDESEESNSDDENHSDNNSSGYENGKNESLENSPSTKGHPAEDSDEHEKHENVNNSHHNDRSPKNSNLTPHGKFKKSYIKCPNKFDIYHVCTQYCREIHSEKPDVPSVLKKNQLIGLLQQYPLMPNWRPVYDPGLETFYFWNTQTNQVSWLPIGHPEAQISMSANEMRLKIISSTSTSSPTST